jgi:hypothetical protein
LAPAVFVCLRAGSPLGLLSGRGRQRFRHL